MSVCFSMSLCSVVHIDDIKRRHENILLCAFALSLLPWVPEAILARSRDRVSYISSSLLREIRLWERP